MRLWSGESRFSEGLTRENYIIYVIERFENKANWRQHD